MSSFDDVKQATCQILKDDGQSNSGTGFFILPGGFLLTCHHVIFGLKRLQVKIPSEQEPYDAEYIEEYSDLKSDFAVLRVPTISITPVQLGHIRLGNKAYAYGFRPSSVAVEPKGHSYSGQIGPGQQLQFPIPSHLLSQLQGLPPEERQTWNNLPPENAFRIGDICNFQGTWGLEKGISGGPVYDPQLRRVVGMFRAVEGDEHAYILPIDNVFEHWADLEKKNRDQVIDTPLDQLDRYFGVRLLGEGAKPIHSVSPRYFDSVISKHTYFGGRKEELKALNDFVGEKCTGYFFITGPSGFGKTALLTQWIKQLRLRHVETAFHFITPRVRCGTEAEFYFENLCCQLLEFHGLGGELPPREKLPLLYADLLKLAPPPERRIVLILDGLDEAIGRWEPSWEPGSDIFPQDLAEGIQVVFSARAIADKDWLEDLKLSLSDDHVIVLEQLSLTDIKDALNQSDIFSGTTSLLDQAARRLLDLSEGDPFYFQDLLLDLEQSNGDLERLDKYPIGHSNYLKQWWQDAYTDNPAFVDLMGTLTIARAPLDRKELINISKDDEIRGATFHKLIRQVARYLSGSQTEGYQISHNRIREFIHDQLEDEIEVYRNRFVKFCWHWRDAPKGSPRDYTLRYGIDHILEQDREHSSSHKTRTLELCLREEGAFLLEAIKHSGLRWIDEQMQRVFTTYFEKRLWHGAARSLLYLRLFQRVGSPVESALRFLVDQPITNRVEFYLKELERIPNESLQRAIAVLSAARLHDDGHGDAADAVLDWLCQRHGGSVMLGTGGPDAEAVDAILSAAPLEFAEQFVKQLLYAGNNEQLPFLATVWTRDPGGSLHDEIFERIKQAVTAPDSVPIYIVEGIARAAIEAGDSELCLAAIRLIGASSHEASVETLAPSNLLALPANAVVEVISELCKNLRMRKHRSLRVAVCALVLLGSTPHDETYLIQMAEDLARVANVSVWETRYALAEHGSLALDTWGMSPSEFHHWLSTRLSIIANWPKQSGNSSTRDLNNSAAIRKLVSHFCIILRWVAAQSEGSASDKMAVASCLSNISALAWLDADRWDTPLLQKGGKTNLVPREMLDPLRAYACWKTGQWLASEEWLPFQELSSGEDLDRAATHEIVQLIFEGSQGSDLEEIEVAISNALGSPPLRLEESAEGSPWLEVLKAIAASVGVSWQPAWSTELKHDHRFFPDHLNSHLKQLRERIVEIADNVGFYPPLLMLCVNLVVALGENDMNKEELKILLVPALATMDSAIVWGMPNSATWPPNFTPLCFARKVPRTFAKAVSCLELCSRGMLWKICWNMCQGTRDTQWWGSVKEFRESLRKVAEVDPKPPVVQYENDKTRKSLIEDTLAPINLQLDIPPQKPDFDILTEEVSFYPHSSCVRLKSTVQSNPRSELLEWSVAEYTFWKAEQSLWLIKPLVQTRRWDLLYFLFNGLYGQHGGKEQDWLSGFPSPEEDKSQVSEPMDNWQDRLEEILGLGPEEGLIYRLGELARSFLSGNLNHDEKIRKYKEKIRLTPDWEDSVEGIFQQQNVRPHAFVRCLLAIALLSGDEKPALLAEHLVESSSEELRDKLGPELLWIGKAVAPTLLRKDRIFQVARTGKGLEALARLRETEAIRIHLQSCAEKEVKDTFDHDPLLQWYHECGSITLFPYEHPSSTMTYEDQLICLRVYNEMAPHLLITRHENSELILRSGRETLMPVHLISDTLKYLEYKLSQPVVDAVHDANPELARSWFRAVLIEASLGPNRKKDLDCFKTICRCAGAWLTIEKDSALRDVWMNFIKEMSEEFETRSLWRSFFGGVGMSLEDRFGVNLDRWIVGDDYGARIALAEALALYGTSSDAKRFWLWLIEGTNSPWLGILACESFLFRETSKSTRQLTPAQEFAVLAWEQSEGRSERKDPRFLADVTECAIATKSGSLLEDLFDFVADDSVRVTAIARIAIDVFLRQMEDYEWEKSDGKLWDQQPWKLPEIVDIEGMRKFMSALVDEAAHEMDGTYDIGRFNHNWRDNDIKSGLGWLIALLQQILEATRDEYLASQNTSIIGLKEYRLANKEEREVLLAWVTSWIGRISPDNDDGWKVSKLITDFVNENPKILVDVFQPLLNFAIASLSKPHGSFDSQVDLVLNLIKAHYRIDDCLGILDLEIERQSQRYNVDRYLARVAETCEREFSDSGIAERYISRLLLTDKWFLVEDKLAETRGVSLHKRLLNLNRAPQVPNITERMAEISREMLGKLSELEDQALITLAGVLVRLFPDNVRLNDEIAANIGRLLEPDDLTELHKYAEQVNKLARLI